MKTSPVTAIQMQHQPSQQELDRLGVDSWPIWTKEVSEFPWTYDVAETCYFLTGEVTVTTDDGVSVTMGTGDLVTFPAGMSCTWKIHQPVRKHYQFG
ncbi:MAG: cupin domain-containing protein [Snowella sp.]